MSTKAQYILMLGPSPEAFGGMASVVKAYQEAGLFDQWPILQVDTTAEVRRWSKVLILLTAIARVVAMGIAGRVQLLHMHVATRTSFYRKSVFMILGQMLNVPYVVHLHGADFDVFYLEETGSWGKRFIKALFDKSAAIIVLGDKWKAFVSAITDNPRVVCIHNPVRLSLAPQVAKFSEANKNVLFLGELGSRKGVPQLLSAIALVRQHVPGVKLILCGNGNVDMFAMQADELGLSGLVSFPGWVVGEEKTRILSEAAVLALPSYHEGLPMTILEAMAAGVPVVATDVGSVSEAVEDGSEGFLVQPGDVLGLATALERILMDPSLRQKMGRAAHQKAVEKFEDRKIVARLSGLYLELGLRQSP